MAPLNDLRAEDDPLRALVEHSVPALPAAEATALRERVTGRMEVIRDARAAEGRWGTTSSRILTRGILRNAGAAVRRGTAQAS
jgi:hypothetical protein